MYGVRSARCEVYGTFHLTPWNGGGDQRVLFHFLFHHKIKTINDHAMFHPKVGQSFLLVMVVDSCHSDQMDSN